MTAPRAGRSGDAAARGAQTGARAARGARAGEAVALAALAAAAFVLRARGADTLAADGGAALPIGDAADHARRALWTVQHGPGLLHFDPLVAFPDGAWLPLAPLHTGLVAALAWGLGGDANAVEQVGLWLPPLLGALTVLPVHAAAARLGGRGAGLGAAALFAALPLAVAGAAAGELGPQALLGLLGAAWLAVALRAAECGVPRGPTQIRVCLARAAALLAAPGGALRVAVADGAQLAALAAGRRRGALVRHALGLAASGALVGLVLVGLGTENPRAALLGTLAGAEAAGAEAPGFALRDLEMRGPALPGRRAAEGSSLPLHALGLALALLALALAALARGRDAPEAREPARVLALWIAGFGALSLAQGRVAGELAAPAAVAAALGVGEAWRARATRDRASQGRALVGACGGLAALVLLAPLAPPGVPAPRAAEARALAAFADAVRAATPETSGFDEPAARPDYGILAPPAFGPALRWRARRAVADGSIPPLASEAEAIPRAERARARFVVTEGIEGGAARGHTTRSERFRLVVEQPAAAGDARYELLERVPGALLEAPAPPGTRVSARLALETPGGRRFTHRATTLAEDDGIARLRVPYPSGSADASEAAGAATVRALGPWRVRIGDVRHDVTVTESDIRRGAPLPVIGPD